MLYIRSPPLVHILLRKSIETRMAHFRMTDVRTDVRTDVNTNVNTNVRPHVLIGSNDRCWDSRALIAVRT